MTKKFEIVANKTYATEANADKAVAKLLGDTSDIGTLRYFIQRTADGRCFPVFVGADAVHMGVHHHFNVIG